MEDYRLSPDLMVACEKEVSTLCGRGVETGGRTLHCLMKKMRNRSHYRNITAECRREVRCSDSFCS